MGIDRRQQRTRHLLEEALLALIAEKPFHDITVQEIADRANVARKTFYAHFDNPQELLWTCMERIFEQLVRDLDNLNPDTLLANGKPLTYPLFQHIADYAPLYRVMFSEHGSAAFLLRVMDYLTQMSYALHAPLRQTARHITVDPQLTAHFLAGAAVNVVIWWLEHDLTPAPETMAYTFSQLAAPGVLAALGLD